MMQLYSNIACMIHYSVRHIGELHRLSREVAPANTKKDLGMHKYLYYCSYSFAISRKKIVESWEN